MTDENITIDIVDELPITIDIIDESLIDVEFTVTHYDADSFLQLLDVPHSYTGQGNKLLIVKADESGLEFYDLSWGDINGILSDQTDLQDALDLKYDSADFNSDFDTRLGTKTTDDLSEGATNLYDKPVSLTSGTGISATGTYPNFTITNTDKGTSAVSTHESTYVHADIFHKSSDDTDGISEGATNKFDKTVSLTQGNNITITGTYPNFTIAATDTDTNDKVKYDANDSTNGYLKDKTVAGTGITLAESSDKLEITNSDTGSSAVSSHLSAFTHSDIAHSNRTALDNVSGTNTGDSSGHTGLLALDQTTPQTINNGQPIQNTLTASQIVSTDANKKLQTLAVATYPSLTELSYVKGVTSAIQTQLNTSLSKTIVIDGDLGSLYTVSPYKKIPFKERGAGIKITSITVASTEANPSSQLSASIYKCNARGTGAFPGGSPTRVRNISTTSGNYSSGAITDSIATTLELYLNMTSAPVVNKVWTITITYTVN